MKKLMIALAVVATAAFANAASVTWSSGKLYNSGDGKAVDGSAGGSLVGEGKATMYLFTKIDSDDYDLLSGLTDKAIYALFTENGVNSTLQLGENTYTPYAVAANGASGNVNTIAPESGYKSKDDILGVGIVLLDNNGDGKVDFYTVSYGSDTATTSGGDMTDLMISKEFGDTANVWTAAAVPEPTSGLLLLLGVAGLALRRRRA